MDKQDLFNLIKFFNGIEKLEITTQKIIIKFSNPEFLLNFIFFIGKILNLSLFKNLIEVEFVKEIFYGSDVEIKTGIEKLGNSSLVVYQEAWQNDALAAKGRAVMVHFDHQEKKSMPIPEEVREQLAEHLVEAD